MKSEHPIQRSQLFSLSTIMLLSPALRLYPYASTALAGRAAWLSAALAALPMVLYLCLLSLVLEQRQAGEGLAELSLRLLGPRLGRGLLALLSLWLLADAAFVLRSGADRFVSTIFPSSTPAPFVLSMGLLAVIAALGSPRSLARVARLIQPLLLGTLLILFLVSFRSIRWENLLPLTVYDLLPAIKGTFPLLDVLSLGLFLPCFLLEHVDAAPDDFRFSLIWLWGFSALMTLLAVAVLGVFGPELTLQLSKPFFTLVRNLVFFRSLERVEALVVALWIFPDFLLSSLLLYAGQHSLRLCLGGDARYRGEKRLQMDKRRWLIPLCGALVIGLGLVLAPDSSSLSLLSERIVPAVNLGVCLLCPPLLYLALRVQKKT